MQIPNLSMSEIPLDNLINERKYCRKPNYTSSMQTENVVVKQGPDYYLERISSLEDTVASLNLKLTKESKKRQLSKIKISSLQDEINHLQKTEEILREKVMKLKEDQKSLEQILYTLTDK